MKKPATYVLRLPTRSVAVHVEESKDRVMVTMRYHTTNPNAEEHDEFERWLIPILAKHAKQNTPLLLNIPQNGTLQEFIVTP